MRLEDRRRYATRTVQQRLHQSSFRLRVLDAYHRQCAVCRLRHMKLLQAAHIIPDSDPRSQPVIPGGIALCSLHHAAFDSNIIGIRPDCVVEVRREVLEEEDGPMLQHGLQEVHGMQLHTPRSPELRPSTDLLEIRYEQFRRVA